MGNPINEHDESSYKDSDGQHCRHRDIAHAPQEIVQGFRAGGFGNPSAVNARVHETPEKYRKHGAE